MDLDTHGWLTLAALALMFLALVRELFGPDLIVFTTLVALWTLGVIDARDALAGFSNPQVLAVALLFIIAAAMKDTGALSLLTRSLLRGDARGPAGLTRLLLPTALISAFLNNTPIVAMLAPEARDWALRSQIAPSKVLIPLSYITILGGTCTLIGTSTNLLVSGLMEAEGLRPLGMFELTPVGLPITLAGLLLMVTLGPRLLPDRAPPDAAQRDTREFSARLLIGEGCAWVGRSVEEAGLRHLQGLFLVQIARGEQRITPVRPSDRLERGDRLTLVGVASTVVELLRTPGLTPLTDGDRDAPEIAARLIHEVVIPERSSLIGQNLRQASFRRRYDAAVIAIHRGGQRLLQKLGDVELRAGDTLLLQAAAGFRDAWGSSGDMVLLGAPTEVARSSRGWLALCFLAVMVALISAGLLPTVQAAALTAVALLLTRCLPLGRARSSLDLSVLVLMASSFGLSAAVQRSGLAAAIAALVERLLGDLGPLAALALLYLLCMAVTEALSNAAAAALTFPIALATARGLHIDPRPLMIAITVAASMSFLTPLGYQTNLLVYGPGGYRFSDFLRLGAPMSLLAFALSMWLIPWFFPLR
jgi:di/tricarboxylate transporter